MTRELIINGQHVDLPDSVDITLEFANNVVDEVGKITLAHSYTIKLPRTIRNARILDDPGTPAHDSTATRRFLSARYYRNGLDLIGPGLAYLLATTPEAYEVALVWSSLEAIQTLSQSDKTLNDLPNLPVLPWIDTSTGRPDYYTDATNGAGFAQYYAGFDLFAKGVATHPYIYLGNLLTRILDQTGAKWSLSETARASIANVALLAAPSHAPNLQMEIESGTWSDQTAYNYRNFEVDLYGYGQGWDALPLSYGDTINAEPDRKVRFILNIKAKVKNDKQGSIASHVTLRHRQNYGGGASITEVKTVPFELLEKDGDYYWWGLYMDETVSVPDDEGEHSYDFEMHLDTGATTDNYIPFFPIKSGLPQYAAFYVHEHIDTNRDNRFPLEGNLPDIKQWEFVKSCAALFGWVLTARNNELRIMTAEDALDPSRAIDWTHKVDASANADKIEYELNGWAQQNTIQYKPDEDRTEAFAIVTEDATADSARIWHEAIFSASQGDSAVHYKQDNNDQWTDVNIQPRIFTVDVDNSNNLHALIFNEALQGASLKSAHYDKLQNAVRKPVKITTNIRLHELDIAELDLTRPVYLSQYGHYYTILKIQTSATDLCKVELLQLP